MTDEPSTPSSPEEHATRVRDAFASLQQRIDDRLDPASRESLDALRDAAAQKNAEGVRKNLSSVRESHGWLYRELAEHPEIANLLNELALWGF